MPRGCRRLQLRCGSPWCYQPKITNHINNLSRHRQGARGPRLLGEPLTRPGRLRRRRLPPRQIGPPLLEAPGAGVGGGGAGHAGEGRRAVLHLLQGGGALGDVPAADRVRRRRRRLQWWQARERRGRRRRRVRVRQRHPAGPSAGRGGAVLGGGGRGGAGVVRGGVLLQAGAPAVGAVLPLRAAPAEALRAGVRQGGAQARRRRSRLLADDADAVIVGVIAAGAGSELNGWMDGWLHFLSVEAVME